jgi:hypothetical protein
MLFVEDFFPTEFCFKVLAKRQFQLLGLFFKVMQNTPTLFYILSMQGGLNFSWGKWD